MARVISRPAAQQPNVPSHKDHASVVCLGRQTSRLFLGTIGLPRAMLAGQRTGSLRPPSIASPAATCEPTSGHRFRDCTPDTPSRVGMVTPRSSSRVLGSTAVLAAYVRIWRLTAHRAKDRITDDGRISEDGVTEVNVPETGPCEVGIREVNGGEIGTDEDGVPSMGAGEIRAGQISACHGHVRQADAGPIDGRFAFERGE